MTSHIYVFVYDVARDSRRARIAELLGESLCRVQKSVFEGRMAPAAARRLAQRAAKCLGPEDSLRAYAVTADGLADSLAIGGGAPLPEAHDFLLF
jgi:CRISPR-associated endonuclease Cas2